MNEDNLKHLVSQGLQALKAAGELGEGAAAEIAGDASDPGLKELLSQGSERAKAWQEKIERALQDVGEGQGSKDNPVIQAHYEVSKRIRAEADSPETRDLGIVASGQLVMHYYIAAFGTLRTYSQRLGNTEAANTMQGLLDEAKQADEEMTQVAERIMGGTGAHAGNNASVR